MKWFFSVFLSFPSGGSCLSLTIENLISSFGLLHSLSVKSAAMRASLHLKIVKILREGGELLVLLNWEKTKKSVEDQVGFIPFLVSFRKEPPKNVI